MPNPFTQKLRNNYDGFWKDNRWLFIVFAVAMLCDAISTVQFMSYTGPAAELHPAISFVSVIFGPVAGPLIGAAAKIIGGIFVAVYWRRFAGYIFMTASVISFWAAWYNLWGFRIYTPGIFYWFPF